MKHQSYLTQIRNFAFFATMFIVCFFASGKRDWGFFKVKVSWACLSHFLPRASTMHKAKVVANCRFLDAEPKLQQTDFNIYERKQPSFHREYLWRKYKFVLSMKRTFLNCGIFCNCLWISLFDQREDQVSTQASRNRARKLTRDWQ